MHGGKVRSMMQANQKSSVQAMIYSNNNSSYAVRELRAQAFTITVDIWVP